MIEASTTAGTATSSASGGGGAAKKKRRKRGGGSGGSKEPSTPQTSNSSKVLSSGNGRKDASIARTASSGGATRGAKNSKKRRGGRGGEESKRNTSSSSPMQLPHVKVTLRNILDENKHGTVKAIVDSLKIFLDGAFHSSPGTKIDEQNGVFGGNSDKDKFDAYSLACRQEKDQFEREKSMLTYTASSNENTNSSTSASPRPLSFGWVYEVKQTSSQLPSIESVASDVIEKEKSSLSNRKGGSAVNAMVDAAMAQMMLECGKKYLDFVGGKVVLDEDSAVDVMLAEMVQAAKKKMAAIEGQKIDADDGDKNNDGLAEVTELMSNLDTTNPKSNAGKNEPIPAVKIRILSVTPVKKSKRRGIIGGTVNLALYPPDPCMLFKENCRDAGRIAGEKYLMAQERAKEVAAKKSEANNVDGPVPENKREADAASGHSIDETTHTTNTENDSNKAHLIKKMAVPPIPHFPIMTPAERSRAVARSRVLLYRTIRAMKIFAQSKQNHPSDINFHSWDIAESPSQKTWKNRPHPMVTSLLNGVSIDKILAEEQSSIAGSTSSKRWRKGYSGDARADRYDSTIESSDDYKTFMEQWSKDGTIRLEAPADESKDKEKETAKPSAAPSSYAAITSKKEEGKPPQPEFDEEGRPLSAIVMHIRAKQEEAAKAKAEAAAAAARARAAAATMAASKKKKKNDVAVAASSASSSSARKKKRDATKSKKSKSKSTSRAGGESKASTMASPPPGAVFLKKGG